MGKNRWSHLAWMTSPCIASFLVASSEHRGAHCGGNGVHAVDGTWNINGKPLANAEIGEAVSHG